MASLQEWGQYRLCLRGVGGHVAQCVACRDDMTVSCVPVSVCFCDLQSLLFVELSNVHPWYVHLHCMLPGSTEALLIKRAWVGCMLAVHSQALITDGQHQ
jgi:hypothetical protein